MISLPGNQDVIHSEDRTSKVFGAWILGGIAKNAEKKRWKEREKVEQLLVELVTVMETDKKSLIKYSCFNFFFLSKVSHHSFNF